MHHLVKEIIGQFDDQSLNKMGDKAGISSTEVQGAMGDIVPMILGAVDRKAASPSNSFDVGSLIGFLDNDKDGDVLDDIAGFVSNESGNNPNANVLGQLFGNKSDLLGSVLGQKEGMNSSSMSKILQLAAPVIISYLGRKKKNQGASSLAQDLSGFKEEMKVKNPDSDSFFGKLIDEDGDGDSTDELLNAGKSLLGRLF